MKQHEAVILTIEKLGGFATLGQINQNIFEIKECKWDTLTPFASIRRIVQTHPKEVYKIKPGLYGLLKYKNINESKGLIQETEKNKNDKNLQELNHYYYQGLLVEIGNTEEYVTYVPHQDQNRNFLGQRLGEITTLSNIYNFAYEDILKNAKTVDVIWFNQRKMPKYLYEVEHSTDINRSLSKFFELQDFNSHFVIVADKVREREFSLKLSASIYSDIKERVKFLTYEQLSNIHSKTFELKVAKEKLKLGF